jgi:hypothetical protein
LEGLFSSHFQRRVAFTRSAINDEAGAKTGISSVVAAFIISMTLVVPDAFVLLSAQGYSGFYHCDGGNQPDQLQRGHRVMV